MNILQMMKQSNCPVAAEEMVLSMIRALREIHAECINPQTPYGKKVSELAKSALMKAKVSL